MKFANTVNNDEWDEYTIVLLQDLLEVLDYDDRYVYLGSSTRPPCTRITLRHMLRKIYSIPEREYLTIRKIYIAN